MSEQVATTSDFNLPIDEIIEDALEMVGGEYVSGFEARSARRSLNLLMIDMRNRGYPLFHMEERSLAISLAGGASYSLDSDVLAILDINIEEDAQETPLGNMSWLDYFSLTDKTSQKGKPASYAFQRTSATPMIYFYQAPDADYTVNYWCIRKPKDVTKSYQLLDIHTSYLPAVTAGLAFFVALKRPNVPSDKIQYLEMLYKERLNLALGEDRDRSNIQIYPDRGR